MKLSDPAAPLNRRDYEPKHPPVNRSIPHVVRLWSPRSQIRWFRRFRYVFDWHTVTDWDIYHVESLSHPGPCCSSCDSEREDGFTYCDDRCCCHADEPGFPE